MVLKLWLKWETSGNVNATGFVRLPFSMVKHRCLAECLPAGVNHNKTSPAGYLPHGLYSSRNEDRTTLLSLVMILELYPSSFDIHNLASLEVDRDLDGRFPCHSQHPLWSSPQ